MTWPETRAPGAPLTDDPGERLRSLEPTIAGTGGRVAAGTLVPDADVPDLSLYTGYGGVATALRLWALAPTRSLLPAECSAGRTCWKSPCWQAAA
jgi:hypothetical protein